MLDGAISLNDFCAANAVSRPTAYREIAAGRLKARKVGRKTIIPKESERAWLQSLPPVVLARSDPENLAA
jgi:excisionase family DNA binding protein